MAGTYKISYLLGLLAMGLIFLAIGYTHQIPGAARLDTQIFATLHGNLRTIKGFFRYMWPLGTTPVSILIIAMTFTTGWKGGLVTILTYTLIAAIERMIKKKIQRPRPFINLQGISMSQPSSPTDSSFPSGDAMRVWFLALLIPVIFNMPWAVWILTCGIAIILSLGRIALGVHYPLDIVGGMGLAFVGASLSLFASTLFICI